MKIISWPLQYVTTSDGVRIAYISIGEGPPLVWASNIYGEANGYRIGWPQTRDASSRADIQFTDAGPVVKEGLRRQACDLFTENVKRRMAGAR
jgi:hypothetical protein